MAVPTLTRQLHPPPSRQDGPSFWQHAPSSRRLRTGHPSLCPPASSWQWVRVACRKRCACFDPSTGGAGGRFTMTPQLVVLAVDSALHGRASLLAGTGSTGSQGHHRNHVVCFAANAASGIDDSGLHDEFPSSAATAGIAIKGPTSHRDQGAH